ncbi:MAG: citrate synthase family protein [Alphaproteobacteria bacterium]|jgi:citrate synthase|nr:citrate synthase family protein [Alphaproteobacteria bacterium]MDP6831456.1 citrate synthase family protein [Alphaproteobacteria bacterium]MDP6873294.1 citrate synthase family protein [Alphaproteobacteria bacterium]
MAKPYLNAREAAAELNVSRATLYAYVSRGLVRSEPVEGSRSRLYRADDVRAIRARKTAEFGAKYGSETIAATALTHGTPILDSAITLIADGALYYRGRDASELARGSSLESVAGLLWQCDAHDPFAAQAPDIGPFASPLAGIARCQALLPLAASQDLRAYNLESGSVARTGADLLRLLTAGFTSKKPSIEPIHAQLAAHWGGDAAAAKLIRAALVLCADHELNASTFTVRCVASTRATPYGAVMAGLSALQGPRHGGQSARVAALFDEVLAAESPLAAVAARLRRGERLPGFGHTLYPDGDPRCKMLRRMLAAALGSNKSLAMAEELAEAGTANTGLWPNVDFSLIMLQRSLDLPAAAPVGIFAIGRCAGWIAHAQEQYARPELIRPRARYVGEQPQLARTPISA